MQNLIHFAVFRHCTHQSVEQAAYLEMSVRPVLRRAFTHGVSTGFGVNDFAVRSNNLRLQISPHLKALKFLTLNCYNSVHE